MGLHNAYRHNGTLITPFAAGLLDEANARAFCAAAGLWHPLAKSGTLVSHTGDTNETVLATISLPAGAMGANGQLIIDAQWSATGTNTKTPRVRIGGVSGSIFSAFANTTNVSWRLFHRITNRNSQSSQVGTAAANSGVGGTATTSFTATVDTSAAQDIVFTGQLTNTGESITLESYLIEVLYGA